MVPIFWSHFGLVPIFSPEYKLNEEKRSKGFWFRISYFFENWNEPVYPAWVACGKGISKFRRFRLLWNGVSADPNRNNLPGMKRILYPSLFTSNSHVSSVLLSQSAERTPVMCFSRA